MTTSVLTGIQLSWRTIPKMRQDLIARGWLTDEVDEQLRREVGEEVDRATEAAEAAPEPDASTLTRHVYADA